MARSAAPLEGDARPAAALRHLVTRSVHCRALARRGGARGDRAIHGGSRQGSGARHGWRRLHRLARRRRVRRGRPRRRRRRQPGDRLAGEPQPAPRGFYEADIRDARRARPGIRGRAAGGREPPGGPGERQACSMEDPAARRRDQRARARSTCWRRAAQARRPQADLRRDRVARPSASRSTCPSTRTTRSSRSARTARASTPSSITAGALPATSGSTRRSCATPTSTARARTRAARPA